MADDCVVGMVDSVGVMVAIGVMCAVRVVGVVCVVGVVGVVGSVGAAAVVGVIGMVGVLCSGCDRCGGCLDFRMVWLVRSRCVLHSVSVGGRCWAFCALWCVGLVILISWGGCWVGLCAGGLLFSGYWSCVDIQLLVGMVWWCSSRVVVCAMNCVAALDRRVSLW